MADMRLVVEGTNLADVELALPENLSMRIKVSPVDQGTPDSAESSGGYE